MANNEINNAVEVFTNKEFGEVRTVMIGGEPWFVGKDVAVSLGYTNPQKALRDHIDEEDRTVNDSFTVNGTMGTLINESGIYSLVISSKLPDARRFKHWITSEVLPSLRKHGAYMTPQTLHECLRDPRAMANILNALADEQDKNRKLESENAALSTTIEEQKPKVEFADHVSASENSVDMGEFAKIAYKNGVTLGRNNLFKKLRQLDILMDGNIPYQRYMDAGWFEVVEYTYRRGDTVYVGAKTLVTGKGQIGLVRKLRKAIAEERELTA